MTDYDREWLNKSQKLITKLAFLLSRGQTETAMWEIDTYWHDWRKEKHVPVPSAPIQDIGP